MILCLSLSGLIAKYRALIGRFLICCDATCVVHQSAIASCVDSLLQCITDASLTCLPTANASYTNRLE